MRTVIGVLQCEQFIDQGICFPVGHLVISLYRSLTCHGGQSGSKDSKWILILLRSKIVKHFQKEFFFMESVQICRNCTDTVFPSTKGFNLKTVFPETRIQLCIIHQIRNTMKYIAYKDSKAFMKDLKRVYGAESEEIAFMNLEAMKDSWKKYRAVVENWQMKWENLSTYFSYGPQIRRLI